MGEKLIWFTPILVVPRIGAVLSFMLRSAPQEQDRRAQARHNTRWDTMAQSKATTVAQYLSELPPERAAVVSAVRDLVNAHLPEGFDETMRWGMISWEVPLATYPDTYNGQPLNVAALSAQKQVTSLYLMCAYIDPDGETRLRDAYAAAGMKLDFGKSCLRFKSLDRFLPEAVIPMLEQSSVAAVIGSYEAARGR